MVMPLICHQPNRKGHHIQIGHLRPWPGAILGMAVGELPLKPPYKVHMLGIIETVFGGFLAHPVR